MVDESTFREYVIVPVGRVAMTRIWILVSEDPLNLKSARIQILNDSFRKAVMGKKSSMGRIDGFSFSDPEHAGRYSATQPLYRPP